MCVCVCFSKKKKKNYELDSSYVIYSYILISLLSVFSRGTLTHTGIHNNLNRIT